MVDHEANKGDEVVLLSSVKKQPSISNRTSPNLKLNLKLDLLNRNNTLFAPGSDRILTPKDLLPDKYKYH